MGNLWLKFRVWTKVAAFGFFLIYALAFTYFNYAQKVKFWLWYRTEPDTSVLGLALVAFLVGVIGTILVRTTLKTVGQIKQLRSRGRSEKMERQMAAMHAKAGRLQTKREGTAVAATPAIPVDPDEVV
jgi:hypothetical protein